MGVIENRWRFSLSRRRAFASFAGMFAASPLLKAQIDPHSLIGHKRIPRIDELVDAFDFEALCYRNMTLEPYDYMAHGDGSEWNLRRNRQVFDWVDIVQGKAVDPASVDMSSVILGVPMKFPIFTAPSSGQGALHPDGEIGMYRGATAANALAAFASGTTVPHQKIAPAATGPRWQQFYPIPDLGASAKQLQMFQDLGAKAIIITVDQQASVYERDLHDRHLGGVVQTGGGGVAEAAVETRRRLQRRRHWRRVRLFQQPVPASPASGSSRRSRNTACRIGASGTAGNTSTKSASSSRCRSFSRASSRPKTPKSASRKGSTASSSRTTAGARWITGRRRSKCFRRSWPS